MSGHAGTTRPKTLSGAALEGQHGRAGRVASVLVIDDDADYGELVRRALRRASTTFDVTHVRDGFACLEALRQRSYSVVLLDYGLPRINGLEVLARIRALGIRIPVVMATGQGDERIAVQAMKAGAADYVIKTSGYFATLPTVLDKAMKQHELAVENARLFEEAQRQRTRLAQIFDSTSDGIVLVEGEGRVVCANRRAGDLLGFDAENATDLTLVDLIPGDDGDPGSDSSALAPFRKLLESPLDEAQGDLEIARSARVLHWVGQPIREADVTVGLTLTFHDVTREREVSRMKSDFVSFVAHQLRTPLSGIKWMLELAADESDPASALASHVQDAAASAERLITMVNDLLDIGKLESGALTIVPRATDVAGLTRSVLDDLSTLIREKAHRLSVSGEATVSPVLAEPQLLRQVVVNLVSNAVKYTPSGGAVAIRMGDDGRWVRWAIEDTGIGIPKDARHRLFEKFYRADNALTVETEGSGLGLYLVRLIVERLGGRIDWMSAEGTGTTFDITLPRAR